MAVFRWLMAVCLWVDLLFPPCLAVYALIRWQGRWRLLAVAPMLVAIPAAVSFWHAAHRHASLGFVWLLLYALLALAVSAYSGGVLLLYCKPKPSKK